MHTVSLYCQTKKSAVLLFCSHPLNNRRVFSPYYSHFSSSTILVVIAWAKNRRRSEFPLTALKVVLQFPHDNGHWREHAHRFLYTSAIKGQCAIQHSCKQDVRIPTSSQNSITSRVNDRRKKIHLSEFWIAHLSKYGMLLRSSLVNSLSASPLNTSATSLAAISCCSSTRGTKRSRRARKRSCRGLYRVFSRIYCQSRTSIDRNSPSNMNVSTSSLRSSIERRFSPLWNSLL